MGDERGTYDDDGFSNLNGKLDYAIITDLNVFEDRIILHVSATQYALVSAASGLELQYVDASGRGELIATFGSTPSNLSL